MSNSTITTPSGTYVAVYTPNVPAAWVFAFFFTFIGIFQVYQYAKHRSWYLYTIVIAITLEVFGFWCRAAYLKNPVNSKVAVAAWALTSLGPSFLLAATYQTYGRMAYWITPESKRTMRHLWAPLRHVTSFFVSLDFLTSLLMTAGILLIAAKVQQIPTMNATDLAKLFTTSHNLLKAAFIMQLIFHFYFIIICVRFLITSNTWKYDWPESSGSWRRLGHALLIGAILLFIREIYRALLVNLNGGNNYLRNNEWTYYFFDVLPIFFFFIVFSLRHPGSVLPEAYTTVTHAYKQPGFRPNFTKETIESEKPVSSFNRVTVIPPPLNTSRTTDVQKPTFTDPWNNQPTPNALSRYN